MKLVDLFLLTFTSLSVASTVSTRDPSLELSGTEVEYLDCVKRGVSKFLSILTVTRVVSDL